MFHVCTLDVSGIQRYIFGSNHLRDNLGASLLVERATGAWLREAIQSVLEQDTWRSPVAEEFFQPESSHPVFVVHGRGGSAQVLFRDPAQASAVLASLSRRALEEAPGLRLLGTVTSWDGEGPYQVAGERARDALERMKSRGAGETMHVVPGIVERCDVTGGPATRKVKGPGGRVQSVSESLRARREAGEGEQDFFKRLRAGCAGDSEEPRWFPILEELERRFADLKLCWESDLDRIRGRKGEKSFLGVIHIDGNGMGEIFRKVASAGGEAKECLAKLGRVSREVDEAVVESVLESIRWLLGHVGPARDGGGLCLFQREKPDDRGWEGGIPLGRNRDGQWAFPMRPIVVAGDDTTLVVEGSVALELAERITSGFSSRLGEISGIEPRGACAGVALGKAHSPFWRLYELAERACKQAKAHSTDQRPSCLDWEFLDEKGLKRELTRTARPYALDDKVEGWCRFVKSILTPLHRLARSNRSQVKALASDLATGTDAAVRRRLARWSRRGLDKGHVATLQEYAREAYGDDVYFKNGRSSLADGVALLDFSIPAAAQGSEDERT